MPKINADGNPTFADARGTDETAVSADGSVHYLDPTASVRDGELKDNDGLKIEGDDAEQFETREEKTQRELREREQDARERTDEVNRDAQAHRTESGDYDPKQDAKPASVKGGVDTKDGASSAGTSSKGSSTLGAKNSAKN